MTQGQGIYAPSPSDGPLVQGEILSQIEQVIFSLPPLQSPEDREFEVQVHPWVIVMTQDCDLAQDYRKGVGSMTPNILFCEVSTAEELSKLLKGSDASARWTQIQQNKDPRYHFLQRATPEFDFQQQGLDEFGIDFKRYFTLPSGEVYSQLTRSAKRHCFLNSPYLEHLAQRFSAFLSRVALDSDHMSE